MDLSVIRFSVRKQRSALAIGGLLALTACAGSMQAGVNSLLAAAVSNPLVGITCSTLAGIGTAQTITVTPLHANTTSTSVIVTLGTISPGLTVTPATGTLTSSTTSLVFTVNAAPGCVGLTTNSSNSVQFKSQETGTVVAVNTDVAPTVVSTLTTVSGSTPLVAPAVTVTCGYGVVNTVPTWVPSSSAQTISVTSSAAGGTPFTVTAGAAWASLSSLTGGTATSAPVTFSVTAAAGCGAYTSGTNSTTITLVPTGGGGNLTATVNIKIVPLTSLTTSPSSVSLSYIKNSGTPASQTVTVSSSVAAFFVVNTATLPIWLTVDATSGSLNPGTKTLHFSTTSVVDSLPPGSYSQTVYLQNNGYGDYALPFSLLINNKTPTLSVASTPNISCSGASCANATLPIAWTLGTALPTTSITVSSNDTPIQYTIALGGPLSPQLSGTAQPNGLAYSFGNQIPITFPSSIFNTLQPGSVVTGTVTFTWGSPASVTIVTISLTVNSPGATLTSASPATLPTAVVGTGPSSYQVTLTGQGFVASPNSALATRVGIVSGGQLITDTNLSAKVSTPNSIILTITVTNSDCPNLPFSPTTPCAGTTVGGPIYLGVVNGTGSIPTGTLTLSIGAGPVIQGVSSASSFLEPTAPNIPTIAPYDMISIFGANFCSSSNTGCGTTTILTGSPIGLTLQYPSSLSPDVPPYTTSAATNVRQAYVQFWTHTSPTLIGTAPLLFVSNGQINAIVPAGILGSSNANIGAGTVDIYVFFGYGSGTTLLKSNAFNVNVAATDPGIFTVGSDGQGSAAALSASYALITATNPAGMRTTTGSGPVVQNSDTIALYVTGLGVPDSLGLTTASGPYSAPASCVNAVGATGYMAALQASTGISPALTNIDGDIIQSSLLNGNFAPCLKTASNPTVTIGGVAVPAASVTYAGFVDDTVAGLYQINVQLPGTNASLVDINGNTITQLTGPATLPVQVAFGSVKSQPGVSISVMPRISVAAPTVTCNSTTCAVGVSWPVGATSGFVASLGASSNYTYAVLSGTLPTGLSLNVNTGMISGIPLVAGSYQITVIAYDSSAIPLTGTVTYTVTVNPGLYLTETTNQSTITFGTASTAAGIITPTAGTAPYTFPSIYSAGTANTPAGFTMAVTGSGLTGTIETSSAAQAGTYNVTVTATDSGAPPLSGSLTVPVVIGLDLVPSTVNNTTISASSGGTVATVAVTGNTGTPTCTTSLPAVTCSASGSTVTLSAAAAALTSGVTVHVTVTVTDTATATGAVAGTYAIGTSASIAITPTT